jgi:LysM repeat protein
MCGASLDEEEPVPEKRARRGLPGWARAVVVVVLASAILVAAGFGFYTLMTNSPQPVTPTASPTRTPTATPTGTPIPTPTASSTPTPAPPRSHQVQVAETLSEIAEEYGVTVEEILALNPDVDPQLLQVGEVLLVPPAAAGATTAPPDLDGSATPPTGYIVHIVEPGETLSEIAEREGVSMESIRLANDMEPYDNTIRASQLLIIPLGTPEPTPTATVDPDSTPSPLPPYRAPPLLSPFDGQIFSRSDEPVVLQWASVAILQSNEWYEMLLLQPPGGVVSVTHHTRGTSWRVPLDLLRSAGAGIREFNWQVQVVRETRSGEHVAYQPAGHASEVRAFLWLEPTPVATPRPSPSP